MNINSSQNITCFDDLKDFQEIPPQTTFVEERDGEQVVWSNDLPSKYTDGVDISGKYLFSRKGESWSIYTHRAMKNSTTDNIKGNMTYTGVNLRWGNKTHRRIIGRILCFIFRDEPVPANWNEMQVNHKNEIPSDNSRENLNWVTPKENCNYGHHNERISAANKGRTMTEEQKQRLREVNKGKGAKPVVQLDSQGREIARYASATEAALQTGVDLGNITKVCNGQRHSAGGYYWRFA